MKTKAQKQDELKEGAELLKKSEALLFVDFASVRTADLRNLRRELKQEGNPMFVMKKRLVGLLMKEHGMESVHQEFKTSIATVFASDLEKATHSVVKFFKGLEVEKKATLEKVLGGYDVAQKAPIDRMQVIRIGQLPTREILLTQLLGMLTAPMRSLLYLLDAKAKAGSAE